MAELIQAKQIITCLLPQQPLGDNLVSMRILTLLNGLFDLNTSSQMDICVSCINYCCK